MYGAWIESKDGNLPAKPWFEIALPFTIRYVDRVASPMFPYLGSELAVVVAVALRLSNALSTHRERWTQRPATLRVPAVADVVDLCVSDPYCHVGVVHIRWVAYT